MSPLSININLITNNYPPNVLSTQPNRIHKKNQFFDDEMWFKNLQKRIQ